MSANRLLGGVFGVVACCAALTGAANKKSNAIVVFMDDHGYADLSYQCVFKDVKTPNIPTLWNAGSGNGMTWPRTFCMPLTPVNLRCQGLVHPQGIDTAQPELSWISIGSDPTQRGRIQSAYQIIVADSESGLGTDVGNLWDSGKVTSDQSLHVVYEGAPLASHLACFWKVRVWDREDAVSPWSEPGSWTMGFLTSQGWQPNWIGGTDRTQVLRKTFTLSKPVKRAWVYASALGLYELRLNGQKVGDDLFVPGWTDYRMRVQYQRYDVTGLVKTGDNAVGAVLAPGWFAGEIAWFKNNQYGKHPLFASQLHVEFTDGSTQVIASDATWKVGSGPLTDSDIQDGDQYDARLENDGWDRPGYNDSNWRTVTMEKNGRRLVAQMGPAVGALQEIKPVSRNQPAPGLYVYDLGQNITGVVRIQVQGAKGTTITLQHAERINDDGTLDRSNLKEAQATDTYIMKGTRTETFQPRFTFHGFRYFSVQGPAQAPALSDVTSVVIGSRVPDTGVLQTSDDALNRLLSNIRWTARNSYLSIPMDSSQRSERLGWTGDANVMAATATFFFDMAWFYAKWQADILDSQALNDGGDDEGLMPNVSPKWRQAGGKGGGWGDVGVNLPYVVWQRYGDTNIIVDSYAGMKKWLTYLQNKSDNYVVSSKVSTAGDWQNVDDDTPRNLIATYYYALDVAQMAQMADAIGETSDAAQYRALFEKIRLAFIDKWVAGDGRVAGGSQTAYVFALYLGLLPEHLREAALQKLADSIAARDTHLSTGYLGSPWLLQVLADNGRLDVAYQVLQQTTYPSWLFMASMNQTTLWESWATLKPDGTFGNKRTSLGHSALGSVGDWMFQTIGGLVPDVTSPGFKHFTIRPRPGGTLQDAKMTYRSPHGRIATRWALEGNRFALKVEVPVNASATVVLPTTNTDSITESGLPAASAPGVIYAGTVDGAPSYQIGSGRYSFAATFTHNRTAVGRRGFNE